MANGLAQLDAHIARVESFPRVLKRAAPEVAEVVEAELLRQIAAGTTPDGQAWQAREDGGKPLATAGKSLAVVAIGTRVFARLRGHIARHHRGIARGSIQRQILPGSQLPTKMAQAVRKVLLDHAAAHMGGGA